MAATEWDSIRVSKGVKDRATRLRDLLLRRGDAALPKRLRGQLDLPPDGTPHEIAVRKFGVGQVMSLALSLLEQEVKSDA